MSLYKFNVANKVFSIVNHLVNKAFTGGGIIGEYHGIIRKNVQGRNNSIFIGTGVCFNHTTIEILGNNCLIEFGRNVKVGEGCVFRINGNNVGIVIGDDVTFTKECYIYAGEDNMSIKIGRDSMLASRVVVRTSDSHGIYNLSDGKRINLPRPVIIGDHVWLAPDSIVLKGSTIGKGCVIGSNSIVTKSVPNNCLALGQPAKVVRENITWTREIESEDDYTIIINK